MKITRTLLASWSMKVIVFLLRGAGGAAFGILVGFTVSYFFRFSGRVDVFALTETMLGVVITGLAIVGAFAVAFQWSNLDSRIQAFNDKLKRHEKVIVEKVIEANELYKGVSGISKDNLDEMKEHIEILNSIKEGVAKMTETLSIQTNINRNVIEEIILKSNSMDNLIKDGEKVLKDLEKIVDSQSNVRIIEHEDNVTTSVGRNNESEHTTK